VTGRKARYEVSDCGSRRDGPERTGSVKQRKAIRKGIFKDGYWRSRRRRRRGGGGGNKVRGWMDGMARVERAERVNFRSKKVSGANDRRNASPRGTGTKDTNRP
jgi:hypothetical protein